MVTGAPPRSILGMEDTRVEPSKIAVQLPCTNTLSGDRTYSDKGAYHL